jgi:hypothetical protein
MRRITSVPFILSVTAVAAIAFGGTAGGSGARAAPVEEALTAQSFEAIKARVLPTGAELAWQRVRWRDGFFDAVLEAQAQDRPIFYWLYEGDPRGRC